MVPIAGYYLGANPATPALYGSRPQSLSQLPNTPPSPSSSVKVASRSSMPVQARVTSDVPPPHNPSGVVNQPSKLSPKFQPTPEEVPAEAPSVEERQTSPSEPK